MNNDIIVIGGGIIGLATAYQILRKAPKTRIALLEKESTIAFHQTGHNSGVIHSGIYYKPGSLKAENCVKGVQLLLEFCNQENIPYNLCGKLIIATNEQERKLLRKLYLRGQVNGLKNLKLLKPSEFKKIEPYANGIEAIHVPQTGIIDYKLVASRLSENIREYGAAIHFNQKVSKLDKKPHEVIVTTERQEFIAPYVINCAGLFSDQIFKNYSKVKNRCQILPFRGEYYLLNPQKKHLLNTLIYPVPDPRFPFLGVHATKRIDGSIEIGPNAVLAFSREGYNRSQINLQHCGQFLSFSGFWKMSYKYWKSGCYELYRSLSKKVFLKDIRKLLQGVEENDLEKGGAGIRAQLVNNQGQLVDDFYVMNDSRVIHILNAPSPAATASLAIGEYNADLTFKIFNLN